MSPGQRSLLEYAVEHAQGTGGPLFRVWRNARRDLLEACERAGIERCSPNDLRRTFASWQVEAGVPLYPIAQAMGHKDTRMLERVYGRQTPEQLAAAMARAMGLTQGVCSTFVSAPTETADPVDAVDDSDANAASSTAAEKQIAPQDLRPGGPMSARDVEVPGPGIEPGTRGFSVPCSTS